MKWRDLIYMILDELKGISDDFMFNEDHIAFLCGKYRAFLLKQRYYSDVKKAIAESNYQTVCLDLIEVPAISGEPCEGGSYLRSKVKVPTTLMLGNPRVFPMDFYQGNITFVSRDRMRFVGYNKWMKDIIYCSIGPDNYLYFKSFNPQYLHLEKVKFSAIFEEPDKISELSCDSENDVPCELMDRTFPIEEALVPQLVQLIVQELYNSSRSNEDNDNNAKDDLGDGKK